MSRVRRQMAPAALVMVLATASVSGQRGGPPQAPPTSKAAAPIDLTGYWSAVVSEDWRYRMTLAPKGDAAGVPLNAAGRQAAGAWDPARDEAAGEQCRAYGAAAGMRMPGRLHITWDNDTTLKLETDAGTQTRLLHFGDVQPPAGDAGWQGFSAAQWDLAPGARGQKESERGGSLKVITTHMRPGYLRKNGVPYSDKAKLTEYFSRTMEPNGDSWLIVTSVVDDPTYLNQPFVTSTHFKRQADASRWNPTPCAAR
jgi:hypothetical protein